MIEAIEGDAAERSAPTRKLNDRQKLAVVALQEMVIRRGEPTTAAFGLPEDVRAVPVSVWRDELERRGTVDPDGSNPRQEFRRLKEALHARNYIAIKDDLVWLASSAKVQA